MRHFRQASVWRPTRLKTNMLMRSQDQASWAASSAAGPMMSCRHPRCYRPVVIVSQRCHWRPGCSMPTMQGRRLDVWLSHRLPNDSLQA